ncbi:MAG: hypothetical protein ACOC1I_07610, partial [Spirochaetota bacterium]
MSVVVRPVESKRDLRDFISFPRELYRGNRQWVPIFDADYKTFYRREHPFFAHAEAEFLLASRDGDPVARVMIMDNKRYNAQHGKRAAHFYFIDFVDDERSTEALFEAMSEWARARGLNELLGPLFSGATYGGGVLVEGFEYRAAMTMMPYNYRYYPRHYERAGFEKHFDLLSLHVDPASFVLPEKVERLADHVRRRGRMKVVQFDSKADLKRVAGEVAKLYNPTLANHGENYPLTDAELDQLIKDLLLIAQPDLEKIITYDGDVVGYMLGFPDLTPAMQHSHGRLGPLTILRLLWSANHARKLILNGMGILEK